MVWFWEYEPNCMSAKFLPGTWSRLIFTLFPSKSGPTAQPVAWRGEPKKKYIIFSTLNLFWVLNMGVIFFWSKPLWSWISSTVKSIINRFCVSKLHWTNSYWNSVRYIQHSLAVAWGVKHVFHYACKTERTNVCWRLFPVLWPVLGSTNHLRCPTDKCQKSMCNPCFNRIRLGV